MNNLSKSQVLVAHKFWVICRNFSPTFVELCMETPYWCIVSAPIWPPQINKNIWSSLFLWKLFLFTRELAYVRINICSNTWNGYTAENQGETLTRRFKMLYFRNETDETRYGNGNLYKDLLFVYLQPSDFSIWRRHCENHLCTLIFRSLNQLLTYASCGGVASAHGSHSWNHARRWESKLYFFPLSNSLYEFFLGHSMNIF